MSSISITCYIHVSFVFLDINCYIKNTPKRCVASGCVAMRCVATRYVNCDHTRLNTRFLPLCSTNIKLFNEIRYIGSIRYAFFKLLRFDKIDPFPIESCTFTPQNGGKITLKAH